MDMGKELRIIEVEELDETELPVIQDPVEAEKKIPTEAG